MYQDYTAKDVIRFWSHVDTSAGMFGCWIWTRHLNASSYGTLRWRGPMELAHRVSYLLAYENLPDNLQVLHKCDNRKCVNPSHLFLGTNFDNVLDKVQKGRASSLKGQLNGRCKISDEQMLEIQELYSQGNIHACDIARLYRISHTQARRVIEGKRS